MVDPSSPSARLRALFIIYGQFLGLTRAWGLALCGVSLLKILVYLPGLIHYASIYRPLATGRTHPAASRLGR